MRNLFVNQLACSSAKHAMVTQYMVCTGENARVVNIVMALKTHLNYN